MTWRWAFWKRADTKPALSGECRHMWSDWTDPAAVNVASYSMFNGSSTEREGWAQDRHCLLCNIYERRLA